MSPVGTTIQKGSIIAYVTEDGRYLMQGGDLIDLDSPINLTEQSPQTRAGAT